MEVLSSRLRCYAENPPTNPKKQELVFGEIAEEIDELVKENKKLKKDTVKNNEGNWLLAKHDSLLKEVHNADGLVEHHSSVALTISAALLAYASSKYVNPSEVFFIVVIGVLVNVEWLFKIIRHKAIFDSCIDRLRILDGELGLNSLRPRPGVFYKNGFKLTASLGLLLLVMWVVFAVNKLHPLC